MWRSLGRGWQWKLSGFVKFLVTGPGRQNSQNMEQNMVPFIAAEFPQGEDLCMCVLLNLPFSQGALVWSWRGVHGVPGAGSELNEQLLPESCSS